VPNVKNTLLQTAFSAILPTGIHMVYMYRKSFDTFVDLKNINEMFCGVLETLIIGLIPVSIFFLLVSSLSISKII